MVSGVARSNLEKFRHSNVPFVLERFEAQRLGMGVSHNSAEQNAVLVERDGRFGETARQWDLVGG